MLTYVPLSLDILVHSKSILTTQRDLLAILANVCSATPRQVMGINEILD